jgi:hypothetical protein
MLTKVETGGYLELVRLRFTRYQSGSIFIGETIEVVECSMP